MIGLDLFLVSLGAILGLGLLTSTVGERTVLPRVTLLLLLGIAVGSEGLDLLPSVFTQSFDAIAQLTLMMVGFLIGGKLDLNKLRNSAKQVLVISVAATLVTSLFVFIGLWILQVELGMALLLAAIAAATAPAAVVDVIQESGVDNHFTKVLLSVVALDDVWALLVFALAMGVVSNLNGAADFGIVLESFIEIVGAVGLGALLGIPGAFLSGRIRSGQPMMIEALSLVCVCGGLALWLGVSYLIASVTMGAVIANLASHHDQSFHEIENVEQLFLIVFFVVAGASLELSSLSALGLLGGAYILLRVVGKVIGAKIGAHLADADAQTKAAMPFALFPQAGVSIGMALVAVAQFPHYQSIVLSLIIGSTVIFELIGPICTRYSIRRALRVEQKK